MSLWIMTAALFGDTLLWFVGVLSLSFIFFIMIVISCVLLAFLPSVIRTVSWQLLQRLIT